MCAQSSSFVIIVYNRCLFLSIPPFVCQCIFQMQNQFSRVFVPARKSRDHRLRSQAQLPVYQTPRCQSTRTTRISANTCGCSLAAACHASACHPLDVNIRGTSHTQTPRRESEGWRRTLAACCRRAHGQYVERALRWTTRWKESWQRQPRRQFGQNQL